MNAWRPLPREGLTERALHILRVDLDRIRPPAALDGLLVASERARLAALHREADRQRGRAGRLLVRLALGSLLDRPPESLPLIEGAHGKPALAGEAGRRLRFNVSHSGAIVLLALSHGAEIGVDIEHHSPIDHLAIAATVFSPAEHAALRDFDEGERAAAFFRGWARKEAILKAEGVGFAQPSGSFTVSLGREDPRLLAGWAMGRWCISDLPVGEDYAAALAFRRSGDMLRLWDAAELLAGGG